MMRSVKYFFGIFMLNIYYVAAWIFAFKSNDTISARHAAFLNFFPLFNNVEAVALGMFAINVVSIFVLIFNYPNFKKPLASTLLIIQLSFGLFGVWQLL